LGEKLKGTSYLVDRWMKGNKFDLLSLTGSLEIAKKFMGEGR
jgi:hypothetical protein